MKSASELHTRDDNDPAGQRESVDAAATSHAVDVAEASRTTSRRDGHIGRVVAGSLIAGLVAAVVLVAGPFAGATEVRTAMTEARSLTSLGNRPLVVVTAQKDAEDGWMAAQDELATLSTNSAHRLLPSATHSMLTEHQATAAQSSQAIRDVIDSIRTGTPLAGQA